MSSSKKCLNYVIFDKMLDVSRESQHINGLHQQIDGYELTKKFTNLDI